jgi:hypothetical protein
VTAESKSNFFAVFVYSSGGNVHIDSRGIDAVVPGPPSLKIPSDYYVSKGI